MALNKIEREMLTWVLVNYGKGKFTQDQFSNSPYSIKNAGGTPLYDNRRGVYDLVKDDYLDSDKTGATAWLTDKCIKELQNETTE